ncbi:EamA family transporter [Ruegeria sp. HKCCA5463]|uniref:EamA family transporter n=1 Tax=Ruegeria sp. HKCCA5463 TaxID=2682994 RepID=UPI001489A435|nr:EamA family transporter [Ruegeria sp. HKCCA5463]
MRARYGSPGLFYLAIIMTGFGAELGLRAPLIDLSDAALAILLYRIFRAIAPGLALSAMVFRLIQIVLIAVSLMGLMTGWMVLVRADILADAPALAFLLMIASNACRGLYLVLLKKWRMHPTPDEGLFVIFVVGIVVLLPFIVIHEAGTSQPLDYSWQVWGSILFIGVGMGAIYLHLINFGTNEVGASTASLFAYLVPIFVAVEAVAAKGMDIQTYQGVGGALIVSGVLIATRLHHRPTAADHPPH